MIYVAMSDKEVFVELIKAGVQTLLDTSQIQSKNTDISLSKFE